MIFVPEETSEVTERRRRSSQVAVLVLAAFLVVYGLIQTWVLLASNFYAYLNDFWILRALAERHEFTQPGSLQDGFFPYLYPFLQTVIPDSTALQIAGFLSLASALGVLWFVWATATRIIGPWWSLIAVWTVALYPQFFIYATVPGADLPAVLALAAALWILARGSIAPRGMNPSAFLVAGVLIAIGGTLRYHILLFAVVPVAYALLGSKNRLQSFTLGLLGLAIGFAPQALVNITSGLSPFSTLQSFNVLRQTAGVDWNATSELGTADYGSVTQVIRQYPHEFLSAYLTSLQQFMLAIVFIGAAVYFKRNSPWSMYVWSLAIGLIAYAAATSLAYSERALIPVIPVWAIGAAVTAQGLSRTLYPDATNATYAEKREWTAIALVTTVLVAWLTLPWVQAAEASGVERVNLEASREQQDNAFASAADVQDMGEVFTNDFFFYSTKIPGFTPRYNDGLIRISQRGRAIADEIDTSSVDSFLCSAFTSGIEAVLWNPGYQSGTSPELAAILSGEAAHPSFSSTSGAGLVTSQLKFVTEPCRYTSN